VGAVAGDRRGPAAALVAAGHAAIVAGDAVIRVVAGRRPSLIVAVGATATALCEARDNNAGRRATFCSEELVYELLDAHADTVQLAGELGCQPQWAAHLDYLRALQRTGRESLAQMAEDRA
jgi:hypothetical protein